MRSVWKGWAAAFAFQWLALAVTVAAPDVKWKTYEAEAFNVRFDIPEEWTAQESGRTFVAAPKDGGVTFIIAGYDETGLSSEELFGQFANEIELQVEQEPESLGDMNGFQAWLGGGTATVDGAPVLVLAVALERADDHVVGYFLCQRTLAEQYQDLMLAMLRRIHPLDPEEATAP